MQDAVLATFFIVQHELNRNAGLPGPLRVRRLAAIADEVAWVGRGGVVMFHSDRVVVGDEDSGIKAA